MSSLLLSPYSKGVISNTIRPYFTDQHNLFQVIRGDKDEYYGYEYEEEDQNESLGSLLATLSQKIKKYTELTTKKTIEIGEDGDPISGFGTFSFPGEEDYRTKRDTKEVQELLGKTKESTVAEAPIYQNDILNSPGFKTASKLLPQMIKEGLYNEIMSRRNSYNHLGQKVNYKKLLNAIKEAEDQDLDVFWIKEKLPDEQTMQKESLQQWIENFLKKKVNYFNIIEGFELLEKTLVLGVDNLSLIEKLKQHINKFDIPIYEIFLVYPSLSHYFQQPHLSITQ